MEQTSKHASREEDLKQSKEPSKPVLFKDECTAFLSNVAFEVHCVFPSQSILIISRHGTAIYLFLIFYVIFVEVVSVPMEYVLN